MRLIDADALKEQMDGHVTSMSVCLNMSEHYGMVSMKAQCVEDINNAPTIHAIPVEWLKEFDLYYAGISGGTKYMNELVEAWQKEQEARP